MWESLDRVSLGALYVLSLGQHLDCGPETPRTDDCDDTQPGAFPQNLWDDETLTLESLGCGPSCYAAAADRYNVHLGGFFGCAMLC
jgi:hypothetical protein